MTRNLGARTVLLAMVAAAGSATAQVDPPPWWLKSDNDTVSLAWNFDNPAGLSTPFIQVAPPLWYNPAITTLPVNPPIQWLSTFQGHTGVLALVGNGVPRTGALPLKVDNDPRPNWIKIFWMQYDEFSSSTGSVSAKLRQNLQANGYLRADLSETVVPIANGWNRVTLQANLIPQPWSEDVDCTLVEAALGTDAIDNLFVNSRCVQPPPDQDGAALGDIDPQTVRDLGVATNNPNCLSACVLTTPLGQRRVFVSAQSTAPNQLLLYEVIGPTAATPIVRPIPASPLPVAIQDLTLVDVPGLPTRIFGVADLRPTSVSSVQLVAVDPTVTPAVFDPAATIQLQGFPAASTPLGLTFCEHGDGGAGSFFVTERTGTAFEFARTGQLLRTLAIPTGVVGAGYDPFTGMLYWFSQTQTPGPGGALIQVHGFEHSLYDRRPTGVEFFGDLALPGATPGGIATGLEVYRRAGNDLRLLCVANVGGRGVMYEMHGPFAYGWSLEGRIGMTGGVPFRGSGQWGVTLSGVRSATFAMLELGFNNQLYQNTPLPFNLGPFGLPETVLSTALDLHATLRPVSNGRVVEPVPLPNVVTLQGVPTFYQWVVIDPTVPGGLTLSQAGKTIIY
ncbi:MAG TPA: hypothetical protein VK348_09875 [Planctomycetota bacterium]|nr:hypothetical protein [Planctomycetota bacterium]